MRAASVSVEIARLRDLDLAGLRARWRGVFSGEAPGHLPRHLLVPILSYRLQANRSGDLDRRTRQFLDQIGAKDDRPTVIAKLVAFDRKQVELTPGTVLMREWNDQPQRVMVMADGFAWNGTTYASLSEVAFAITGTRWNGPRFFGLRDKKQPANGSAGASL